MPEPPSTPDFGTELRAAKAGDRTALDRLLDRIHGPLTAVARDQLGERLRERTRPSDVLQDAFVEVVQRIDEFEGHDEKTFLAWVRMIVVNAARQTHRRMHATKRKQPSTTSQLESLARAIARPEHSPASNLARVEQLELVLRALEQLSDDHRYVIEQFVLRNRPVKDVAEALDRSEPATRMLLSRARAALTMELAKLDRERRTE